MKPLFLTFTGIDERTDLARVVELSMRFPLEWGVLVSPSKQGTPRYPPDSCIARIVEGTPGVRLAMHLCGGDARDVIAHGRSRHDAILRSGFVRAQVNTADPTVDPAAIARWAERNRIRAILQSRGEGFPPSIHTDWLFDTSGGRGQLPATWPAPASDDDRLVGFAGGLSPHNIASAVESIGSTMPASSRYWLDMESRIRDSSDWLDLDLCEAVCRAVFSPAASGVQPLNTCAEAL